MSRPHVRREAVREVVRAAYHAQIAQRAIKTCRPAERREAKANAEGACARVVDMLLSTDVLVALATVAGPLPDAGEGEVA